MKISKRQLRRIIKEEYSRLLNENDASKEIMELYKDGIDPRAAAEQMAVYFDSREVEDAAINMEGDIQTYAYDVIEQMDNPTDISDYLYGGDRRRRY